MLTINNTNLNNMYVNPNFGYGQPAMNPYSFQQTSMFGFNQSMFMPQQTFNFGGYQPMPVQQPFPFISNQSMFAQPQQPANNINSMFMSLISLLLPALLGKNINTPQTPATTLPVTNTNQAQNPLTALFQNILGNQNKVVEAKNFTNAGNLNNLYVVANDFDDINNLGNIGNINVINRNDLAELLGLKTPVTIDQETIEVTPAKEKVFVIGGYDAKDWNPNAKLTLGENIRDFNGTNTAEMGSRDNTYSGSSWHNNVKENDKALTDLLSKLSEEDKKLPMQRGEGYIISESGKVLGKINSVQALNNNEKAYFHGDSKHNFSPTIEKNSSFKILEDLGVANKDADMSRGGDSYNAEVQKAGGEEALGGKIQFNGKTYEVASTVIRKSTPLTFDLNGDGIKTSNKVIDYDIDGDGKLDKINDVADGTLSIRGGKSGLDVFGDNTDLDNDGKADGFKNGFDALKALAEKEGLINGKDDMKLDSEDLKILEDKYQLGMKTDGYNSKEKSLAELGITEINLGGTDETKSIDNFDGQGNLLMQQEGATFKVNGEEREYADVWHEKK